MRCWSINNHYNCLIQESISPLLLSNVFGFRLTRQIYFWSRCSIPHLFGFLFTRQICYRSSVTTSKISASICYTLTIIFHYYQYKYLVQLSIKPAKYESSYRVIVTTAISIPISWAFSQVRLVLIVNILLYNYITIKT